MLETLKIKLETDPSSGWMLAGSLGACFSLIPPALLFGCSALTKSCKRNISGTHQAEYVPERPKME